MTQSGSSTSDSERRNIAHILYALYGHHAKAASRRAVDVTSDDGDSEVNLLDSPKLPFLSNEHEKFVRAAPQMPLRTSSLDSAQPWILFWVLHSLTLLKGQLNLDAETIKGIIECLRKCKNLGGFGGGPGQLPHVATTFAVLAAIATLDNDEATDLIDGPELYAFLMSLKQEDGSFLMHEDGEIDMRGNYCAIAAAKLAGILDNQLAENTAEYIASCQRYDGGIAGEPGGESHAGYAYCGLAALALMEKTHMIDLMKLGGWLSLRQQLPEGGYNGRPHKLVDTCYSLWVNGAFVILQKALDEKGIPATDLSKNYQWSCARSLQEYALLCCQPGYQFWDDENNQALNGPPFGATGGFCDRPPSKPDWYHTCYTLSGLSLMEHFWSKCEPLDGAVLLAATDPTLNIAWTPLLSHFTRILKKLPA